jgi:hypothetical protein
LTAPIWGIVSGYTGEKTPKSTSRMLKAYVDDSGKGEEPFFVLAALVSSAENWATFADEWEAKLSEAPRIDYFKMREAWARRNQFASFTEEQRDKRVYDLVDIINRRVEFFSFCEINNKDWRDILEGKISKTLDVQYYHGYCRITVNVLVRIYQHGPRGSVDFTFDKENETIFREVLDWWLKTKEASPPWIKRRMGAHPAILDDREALPLQAADLLAWITGKRHVSGPQRDFAKRFAGKLNDVPGTFDTWRQQEITDVLELLESANRGAFPYETGAARSARLNDLFGPRR